VESLRLRGLGGATPIGVLEFLTPMVKSTLTFHIINVGKHKDTFQICQKL
jgi:hypothetical protein